MLIRLWNFPEVQVFDRLQRELGFLSPEIPTEAESSPDFWARRRAHLAVWNSHCGQLKPPFVQTFCAPSDEDTAIAIALQNEFDLRAPSGEALWDWRWYSIMIGACAAGLTRKSKAAIDQTSLARLEKEMGRQAWLGANDRHRDRLHRKD